MKSPDWIAVGFRLAAGRPTVGDLMELCEENYRLLERLVPRLRERRGILVSRLRDSVDLHLRIEAQAPYTSLVRLTYVFPEHCAGPVRCGLGGDTGADPDALLRVYHDARQVEVLDLVETALPRHADYRYPALDSKWRVNLFLSKWLAFCLQQGHRFAAVPPGREPREDGDLLYSCT